MTYNKLKSRLKLYKDDVCMKFYNERELLQLETDVSGIGLGSGLLQVREGVNCPSDETPDNTALCPILHSLIQASLLLFCLQNKCDYGLKSLVVIFKNVATLSYPTSTHIHKYKTCILYKPGPELYIADWPS